MQKTTAGWGSGFLGVVIFSVSLPATRVALRGFTPLFLTSARAAIAAVLGLALLLMLRQRRPTLKDIVSLVIVAVGGVVGFPLLTALALREITASQSIVFIGLLPLATATFGVFRSGERPKKLFWLFSGLGSAIIVGYAASTGGPASLRGNLLMGGAVLLCGLGYAEGAILSRRLGGWQVISWALVISIPVTLPIALATAPDSWCCIEASAWIGLAYVSIFSMLVGFIFWYRGLALGGISGVSQLQLLQPFLGLIVSGFVLGESIAMSMFVVTFVLALCVGGAKRFT